MAMLYSQNQRVTYYNMLSTGTDVLTRMYSQVGRMASLMASLCAGEGLQDHGL